MSRENVDSAYRIYDAVTRQDLDGMLALMDDEVELVSILVAVEGGYHGHDGVRRWWENVFDTAPDYTVEVEGVIRDFGDHTLAPIRLRGHGAGSGAPIDQPLSQIVEWRAGRAVRLESFRLESEALAAIGR